MKAKFVLLACAVCSVLEAGSTQRRPHYFEKPPTPKFGYEANMGNKFSIHEIVAVAPEDSNPWELSGLYEGDIMLYGFNDYSQVKNGLADKTAYWPNGTIPYSIDEVDFTTDEIIVILRAIEEYHNKTCVRFRPYAKSDTRWIQIQGSSPGCWSSVGMKEEGQVLNLQVPGCVRHGVAVHELLHALGFYHQQSAYNRDDYVKIFWDNIQSRHEHNFNKYNHSVVTDFDTEYDYGSVMHYSEKAFSKNGEPTIESLKKGVQLGQRLGLSSIDITKLNKMYESSCSAKESTNGNDKDMLQEIIEFFQRFF